MCLTNDQVDAKCDPKLKRKKKPPDPNADPLLAQPTFHTSAVEDAVQCGGELPTIDTSDTIGCAFIATQDGEGEQARPRIDDAEFLQDRTADEAEHLICFTNSVIVTKHVSRQKTGNPMTAVERASQDCALSSSHFVGLRPKGAN